MLRVNRRIAASATVFVPAPAAHRLGLHARLSLLAAVVPTIILSGVHLAAATCMDADMVALERWGRAHGCCLTSSSFQIVDSLFRSAASRAARGNNRTPSLPFPSVRRQLHRSVPRRLSSRLMFLIPPQTYTLRVRTDTADSGGSLPPCSHSTDCNNSLLARYYNRIQGCGIWRRSNSSLLTIELSR